MKLIGSLGIVIVCVLGTGTSFAAAILNPLDFASLGAFPTGDFNIDTDANSFGVVVSQNGAPGSRISQAGDTAIGWTAPPEILVLTFDGDALLAANQTVTVSGERALALLFQGSLQISGALSADGGNGGDETFVAGVGRVAGRGGMAGPGGYAGGGGSGACSGQTPGAGPGGGGDGFGGAQFFAGGGGGGHGSNGGLGTSNRTSTVNGPAGVANGDLSNTLQGGSGGGGGAGQCGPVFVPAGGGGGGGGGIEIGALTELVVDGMISADGGDGGTGLRGGGGGAGGGIRLHAFDVLLNGSISAAGGNGMVNGGCGGGGRIEVGYNSDGSFNSTGTINTMGGGLCNPGVDSVFDSLSIGLQMVPPITSVPAPGAYGVALVGLFAAWRVRRRSARKR